MTYPLLPLLSKIHIIRMSLFSKHLIPIILPIPPELLSRLLSVATVASFSFLASAPNQKTVPMTIRQQLKNVV